MVFPLFIKECRKFVQIRLYLFTKTCLDTFEFGQTSNMLLWTEVVWMFRGKCSSYFSWNSATQWSHPMIRWSCFCKLIRTSAILVIRSFDMAMFIRGTRRWFFFFLSGTRRWCKLDNLPAIKCDVRVHKDNIDSATYHLSLSKNPAFFSRHCKRLLPCYASNEICYIHIIVCCISICECCNVFCLFFILHKRKNARRYVATNECI
jgi:hypothetical protein